MKKTMLKIALSGLVLVAGVSAFAADDEVQLNNAAQTKMSWAKFAATINNPAANLEGVTLDQATKDKIDQDKTAAQGLLTTAKADSTKAKGDLALAAADTVTANKAVADAKKELEPLNKNLADSIADSTQKQQTLKLANDTLTRFNNTLGTLNSDLTKLNGELDALTVSRDSIDRVITALEKSKTAYESQKKSKQDSINSLRTDQTNYTSSSKTTPLPWLQNALDESENLAYAFSEQNIAEYKDQTIYFAYQNTGTNCFFISFVEPEGDGTNNVSVENYAGGGFTLNAKPSTTPSQWLYALKWQKCTIQDFYDAIFGTESLDATDIVPASLYIYLGKTGTTYNYTNGALRFKYTFKVPTFSGMDMMFEDVFNGLTPFKENSLYQTTTTTNTLKPEIQTQIEQIEGRIAPIDVEIGNIDTKITTNEKLLYGEGGTAEAPKEGSIVYKINAKNAEIVNKKKQITEQNDKIEQLKIRIHGTETDHSKGYEADLANATVACAGARKKVGDQKAVIAQKELLAQQAADKVTQAEGALATANDNIAKAYEAIAAADKAETEAYAQAAKDALKDYQSITLLSDVTVTEQIESYSGRINGNGNVITLANGLYEIFNTYGGQMTNVSVNGGVAYTLTSAAKITSSAIWDKTSAAGLYYNASGVSTEYHSLGELGYAVRSRLGADLEAGVLADLSDDTKVYYITVYNANSSPKYYVNIKDNQFVSTNNRKGIDILPANTFAESVTEEAEILNMPNVFFGDACLNAVITEKQSFYCPKNLVASNLTYARDFNAGNNTVCFPFEVSKDMFGFSDDDEFFLCTYDNESANTFWFRTVSDVIKPNTPLLLIAPQGGVSMPALTNVTINKTLTQLPSLQGRGNGISYGTLKKAGRTEFNDVTTPYKVFGLNASTGKFQAAAENAVFPAFRMVIWSDLARENGPEAAPRKIGILDEDGKDITGDISAINDVTVGTDEESSLTIGTAQGEIVFTSDADYGMVQIYSLDGRVAAVADVMAGTTSVNVAKGVYIIMGKKVMVK